MVNEELRQKIADAGYDQSLLYDCPSFDESIIGVDNEGRVVYDYDKMAEEFVRDDGQEAIDDYRAALPEGSEITDEEIVDELLMGAYEFIDYNTIRATPYFGNLAPVVIRDMSYMEDEYEGDTPFQNMINGECYTNEIVLSL